MELHNLKPAAGSTKSGKRIARGEGSGRGGTATKGHKGAKSRSGYSRKVGFEGGQMPLQRRIPKFGFKNFNRVEFTPFNLDRISEIVEKYELDVISPETLYANGIIAKNDLVKVLGNGELSKGIEIHAHAFSKSALSAIEEKGGKAVNL